MSFALVNSVADLYDITGTASPIELLNARTVFQEQGGADYTVTALNTRLVDTGEALTFHVTSIKHGQPSAVCVPILCENDAEYVLMSQHWRPSVNQWQWEFPRGMGESGETHAETAHRELLEETGLDIPLERISILQQLHADTGVLRDDIVVAAIEVLRSDEQSGLRDWELRNPQWVNTHVLRKLIRDGLVSDGITLAAYCVANCNGLLS